MLRSSHTTEGAAAASRRVARFLQVVLPVLLVSLIFQIAGGFSPGWLVYIGDTLEHHLRFHIGLWYYRGCVDDTCKTGPLSDIMWGFKKSPYTKTYNDDFNEYRGETISAMVFCIIAIIVLRKTRSRLNTLNAVIALAVGGIFVLLSGILSTTAASKCADKTRKLSNIIDSYGTPNYIEFPYSLFITGLGGVLSLLALLLLLASQPWRLCAGNQPQQQQHAHQMAVGGFSPAILVPMQTVYQPNQQPPMYDMTMATHSAPPTENFDQPAPDYYITPI